MSPVDDDPGRDLTPDEHADYTVLLPSLKALTRYLGQCGAYGTLEEAEFHLAPLAPKRKATDPARDPYGPGIEALHIDPERAYRAIGGRDDVDPSVSPVTLRQALGFMGARAATTLHGRDELWRPNPHRGARVVGWMRLSREMVWRLQLGGYAPVLTPLPGGAGRGPRPSRPVQSRRVAMTLQPSTALRLVRALVSDREPTVLYAHATGPSGRPLVMRRRGRPDRGGRNVDVSAAMVSVAALVGFAQEQGAALQLPVVTDPRAVTLAFRQAALQYPGELEVRDRVSAPDTDGPVVTRGGWVRWPVPDAKGLGWDVEGLQREMFEAKAAAWRSRNGDGVWT